MQKFLNPLILVFASACAGGATSFAPTDQDSEHAGGGGCGPAFGPPVANYSPGSYAGRDFLVPANHLGEDIAATEGAPVRAVGDGTIVAYRPATGYGELVVVIEHELGEPHVFPNGRNELVCTTRVLSIYGHLRASETRGGTLLPWRVGNIVRRDEVIGYVNDDAHNGDGTEHVHLGLRLMSRAEAEAADPSAWFRGYDTSDGRYRGHFAEPEVVIATLGGEGVACAEPPRADDPPTDPHPEPEPETEPRDAEADGLVTIEWHTPGLVLASRIELSGMVVNARGEWGSWSTIRNVTNTSGINATVALTACEAIAFSVEYETAGSVSWSCLGDGLPNGTLLVGINGIPVSATIRRAGGGCGYMVHMPCTDASTDTPGDSGDPPEAVPPPGGDEPTDAGATDGSANTIDCALLGDTLSLTVHGDLTAATLVDGGLPGGVGFISVGSDETGWTTGTAPTNAYFAIWNGPAFFHTVNVPAAVDRWSFWAAGPAGVRWFNLAGWRVDGAGCVVVPDGFGGLIIER